MSTIEISSERKRKLKNLIKLMNKQNERLFPPVQPLIDSFNLVIDSEELDFLLRMGTDKYTLQEAVSISKMSEDKTKSIINTLIGKGFITIKYNEKSEEHYVLNAIIVGWIEAQVPYLMGKSEEKEFAKKFQMEFIQFTRKYNVFPLRNIMNTFIKRSMKIPNQSVGFNEFPLKSNKKKKIEINRSISESDSKIYPMNSVNDLIKEFGSKNMIAQFPCMCRHMCNIADDPCRIKIPNNGGCLGLGDMVKPYVKHGHARIISMDEALDVIQLVRENGAIHTVFHERDDANLPQVGICNCCWDCCGLLRAYNAGSAPLHYKCYYLARIIDNSECTGCKKCEKYCPTNAISIIDKMCYLNSNRCIGCGLCVFQCPEKGVIELIPSERNVFLPILKKSEARLKL
ncbi:MAG: 4Fe-4S binding protein [Spirochaetota bacterium]|nr:4Fe-4S binding protein [Spirochaetota bacterium]